MKRPALINLLILTIFVAGNAHAQQPTARVFAERFYQTYLELNARGLPDENQLISLAPFLSDDLRRLFEKARVEQERFVKENSADEKPPWADGDLFTSLFEGARTFKIGKTKTRGAYTEISVHLKYRENGETVRWTDTLVLVETKKGWRVWNILLNGDWQFKNGSDLRRILSAEN